MKKKLLLLFSAFALFFLSGCSSKTGAVQKITFRLPVPITVKEYSANPFSMESPNVPVIATSDDGKFLVEGYLVFPQDKNFAEGKIFFVQDDENKTTHGIWTIFDCETNSSKIHGKITKKIDKLENETSFITVGAHTCLFIWKGFENER